MSKSIIQFNEENVKSELKELIRNSVEETLNELLNKEVEELTNATKYERTEKRQGYFYIIAPFIVSLTNHFQYRSYFY